MEFQEVVGKALRPAAWIKRSQQEKNYECDFGRCEPSRSRCGKVRRFLFEIPGAKLTIHHRGQFAKLRIGTDHIQVVAMPAGEKNFHIEIDAPDLNALYNELRAVGIEPEGPPMKQFFGRTQFQVLDPDRNVLEFDTLDAGASKAAKT